MTTGEGGTHVPRETPISIGQAVSEYVGRLQTFTGWECERCKAMVPGEAPERRLCPGCRPEVEAGDAILRDIVTWRNRLCIRAGMSPRELTADDNRITDAVGRALNRLAMPAEVSAFSMGEVPARGYGLAGPAGVGKTFALASHVKLHVVQRLRREVPIHGPKAMEPWLAWVTWPERVAQMRTKSTAEGGLDLVDRWRKWWTEVPVLIVDDLGAERTKGSYVDDWATSILDLVVDGRQRYSRPTWYTTNLTAQEIVARYGARFVSRLCADNPVGLVEAGPDLRMRRES